MTKLKTVAIILSMLMTVGFAETSLEGIGLQPAGQVGIMASAISAVVDTSVTNWAADEGFEGPCSE